MSVAYIGLGGNLATHLGDAQSTLSLALDDLAALPGTRISARSPFYRTAPIDADGPDFINAAAMLDTIFDAPTLLAVCLAIERLHGRRRPSAKSSTHAARTLDLDLLLHDQTVIDSAFLTLPHPRMHQRAFVLAPLLDIDPALAITGHGLASDCLKSVGAQGVLRISD